MTIYSIRHTTTYRYAQPVAFGEHRLLLRPRDGFDQRTREARLDVQPHLAELSWAEDASGNLVGTARFRRRARELRFTSSVVVEVLPLNAAALRVADHARRCPFSYDAAEYPDLARFLARQHADPDHAVDSWIRPILEADADTLLFLRRLNGVIRRDFSYLRRDEHGIQSPATTLRLRRGSCRDFAVLMADAVRAVGFASRFVSGYLYVHPAGPGEHIARGSMHAWIQVYLPGAGWVDFDPTAGTIGNDGLIRTAVTREPGQAVPLSGSFTGFPSDSIGMDVSVEVERLAAGVEPTTDVRRLA